MTSQKIVIIIPTHNEAEMIHETISELALIRDSLEDYCLHVLVFDSASTDETIACVKKLQATYPWLHLQTEPQKSGLGSAYWQAMRFALSTMAADVVFEFDADLSHQPQYLKPMIALLKTHDVVIGSRYVMEGQIPADWGWYRKGLSIAGNLIARIILTNQYKDFTSGFRATKRSVLQPLLNEPFLSNQYAYKLHLLWLLHQHKARICEFPITFVDRTKGQSKLPSNSIIDSLRVILTLRGRAIRQYFIGNQR